jgi:hypothetical protein
MMIVSSFVLKSAYPFSSLPCAKSAFAKSGRTNPTCSYCSCSLDGDDDDEINKLTNFPLFLFKSSSVVPLLSSYFVFHPNIHDDDDDDDDIFRSSSSSWLTSSPLFFSSSPVVSFS